MERSGQSQQKETFQRTGQKSQGNQNHLIESKYQLNEQGRQEQDRTKILDDIQKQIKQCGKRLNEIRLERLKETDEYSERYMELEQERTDIKKRVIDLDYRHKVEIANNMRQSRRKQEEEKQRLIKQAEEQRQKRKKQIDQKLAHEKEQRQKLRKQREDKNKEGKGQQEQGQKNEGEKEQNSEQKLEKSRRQLRIAQIEAQLAQSRLRRSRVSSLSAELQYLRATYSYPYWSWSRWWL